MVAKRHTSLKSYNASSRSKMVRADAPIAEQSTFHGSSFDEYEFMKEGKRYLRLSGREFLTPIGNPVAAIANAPTGFRFAVIPIDPKSLGGRLALMAEQFQFSKGLRFRVLYEPVVPTTTAGAIAVYFNNDIGTPVAETGDDEMAHAATHESFIQTPVWKDAILTIDPKDALLRYADQDTGDARFQVQGMIIVETADIMAIPASSTYGNLYLEYEVEFSVESLDYSVHMREETLMVATSAAAGTPTVGGPIKFHTTTATADSPNLDPGELPSGAASNTDLIDYMFVGTVVNHAGNWVSGNNAYDVFGETSSYLFLGTGCVMRFYNVGGVIQARPFTSIAAASDADTNETITGSWDWPTGVGAWTTASTLSIRGYWIPVVQDAP